MSRRDFEEWVRADLQRRGTTIAQDSLCATGSATVCPEPGCTLNRHRALFSHRDVQGLYFSTGKPPARMTPRVRPRS